MIHVIRCLLVILLTAVSAGLAPLPVAAKEPSATTHAFAPDPHAVLRHGAGWRYHQDGWTVVHIEGDAYDRGYQHGRLLAREIVDYCQTIAGIKNHEAPEKAWRDLRLVSNALFLRHFDHEFLREMQGIADGAASVGGKFDGRPLDLLDVVVINADVELGFLESSLKGTSTGIDSERFDGRHGGHPAVRQPERCSAFVATGPATADGQIVLGHITMSDLNYVRHFNIWLDIQPSTGQRMVFQTFPGGIQSGLDYYINSGGLIVAETTIRQTRFNPNAEMLASRIRRVLQYADSIDRAVEILKSSSNGLYTNEWLLGDIKTNEIAMFELGTETTRLWRSSRDEWVAGTKGFYWGCNNVKDQGVFKETVADLRGKPANLTLHPRIRDVAWLDLFEKHRGRIDADFGRLAFSTAPLTAFPSCDAKYTTAALAKDLKSWAIFGPPRGRTWHPTDDDRETLPSIQPLVPNDWTLLDVRNVQLPATPAAVPVDLVAFPKKSEPADADFEAIHPFAWRGTLLARTDADLWLPAAFAEYEKVVAYEHALQKEVASRDLTPTARRAADMALFQHESHWKAAVRRVGKDIPLRDTRPEADSRDWYDIAAGKGVMLLAALRQQAGAEVFEKCLDEFGLAHAGQEVTTEQFRQHLAKSCGAQAVALLDRWLTADLRADFASDNPWTIFSHEHEPERVLIVYGTLHDAAAQREAASRLQYSVDRRFANATPPIKSDREVTDADLSGHHVLLVGRPLTNAVTARCVDRSEGFPVQLGTQSLTIAGQTYANPETSVVVAGNNPFNPRYSIVVFAGLDAASTWRCVDNLPDDDHLSPQVLLRPAGLPAVNFPGIRIE